MEIERDTDGRIAAQRCYQAIAGARDLEEGQALWRAFGRYHWKGRETLATGVANVSLHAMRADSRGDASRVVGEI